MIGGQAASTAVMMSHRINHRKKVLIPETMNPNLLSQLECYCEGVDLIKSQASGKRTDRSGGSEGKIIR